MNKNDTVVTVEHLTKQYRSAFLLTKVRAVEDVSFEVKRGEVFGFVGPNGAGKTTTIRTLMGLIKPTSGRCTVLGDRVPSRKARARLGFLPESPYFYDYLSARELCDVVGRLFGLDAKERKERAGALLERVGLADAADRPMRKYSKGMLQRAGLAQALMNDPELVVLDEPMSGLDPIGRKDVRDLMVELRDLGKTIFFSTHILPDVEALCDRVAFIHAGKVHEVGPVGSLLDTSLRGTDVVLRYEDRDRDRDLQALLPEGGTSRRVEEEVTCALPPAADVDAFLHKAGRFARVVSVTPRRESLEDVFMRRVRG